MFDEPERAPRHYFVIDVLRGLAAWSILFWHYQHFIALGMAAPGSRGAYPFYALLRPFYEQGGAAVQLFWMISGFVFCAVYAGSNIGGRAFFAHRLARLYPLHLLTLFVVAALQIWCRHRFGTALIYQANTPSEFGLHLLMATGWGIGEQFSFNGPVWSVSAEVLVYAFFWAILGVLLRRGVAGPLILAVAFLAWFRLGGWIVAGCAFYFFCGCAVYQLHRSLGRRLQVLGAIGLIVAFAGLLALGKEGVAVLFLFAGMTLGAAAIEGGAASRIARRVPWIADNTYGTYLWHIPIQLGLLLGLSYLGVPRDIAYSPWFLLAYLALVIGTARLSFLAIERPARRWLRRALEKPAS